MSRIASLSTSSALAVACALLGAGPASALSDSASTGARSANLDPKATEEPTDVTGLTPDQIYAVLVGEVAGRRGDMATAFVHYLRAAELTRSAQMAELAVRAAISRDDDASAGRAIALWLELAPDAVAAHQVAAFLRIKAKDREGALIHLMRLVELSRDPKGSPFAQAAAIVSRVPDVEERVGLMQSLVERFPESADAQQSLAMVAASASRFEVADAAARRAMELRPEWDAPRLFLVRLMLTQGKRDEARLLLEGFVSQSPDDHALRMLYGQFLVEEQEFTTARDVFERLLRNRPKEPDVLFAMGVLSLQLDDLDGARIYFTRLFETGERESEAAFYLGQTEERANDPSAALDWYAKVEGANASDAKVRMAFLYAKSGDVAKAREILQRLRDRSPEDAAPLFMVEAEILDEVGASDAAMAVYTAALETHADDSSLRYARALYAVKLGNLALAEQDLRLILAEDPDHADALNALGYTLADRTGRYREALGYIERAYALKPDEPAILDSMGWVNFRLGHYDAALGFLRRALEMMNDGEIAAHLGETLWALGRRSEAWAVWDAAAQDYPDHRYLQEVIGRHRVSRTDAPGANPKTSKEGFR
ncbi:tetratricopeptide repeat protein [Imhoffiella purpurea]|uniref:TPR domain protein n=1 Tax=Imhoffiella purpurea TaxID=1249627 RepID=W9VZS5_9GAMM|nr:tetratricopeptide repeat protein [Imhoffiella purpurea]EXJ15850.1 TPR domain protein [Imhoffiella purpurea]